MVDAKRWLLWKANKQPFYANGKPRSGALDGPADLAKLVTYAEARKALEKATPSAYAGLGFALGDGWVGVDLDGVRDAATGFVEPWAHELAEKAGTYCEVSPSGTGLHIIGRGFLPTVKLPPVEVYSAKRYFTVTEQVYNGSQRRLAALDNLAADIAIRTRKPPAAPPSSAAPQPVLWTEDRHKAPKLLAAIDPDTNYETWTDVGMALYHASGGAADALALWREWSAKGAKFKPGECEAKWSSFAREDGPRVTFGTLVHHARAKKPATSTGGLLVESSEDLLAQEFTPAERVFDGDLILTPGAHLLTGKPKRGKSWLAMGLAAAACTGESYVNTKVGKPMQALYLACDDPSRARFANRLRAFGPQGSVKGLGLVTKMDERAASALDLISQYIEANPATRFVVIDTLSAFREAQRGDSPYQQEYDELKAINDWAHKHNIVVVIVHHLRKGAVDMGDPFESISGTLGLQGAVDGMLVLERKDLESDRDAALNEKLAALWGRGRDIEEYNVGMKLEDGRWHVVGSAADVFQADTQREILNVLNAHPGEWMNSKEIHAAGDFDCKQKTVQRAATRMAKKGLIESHRGNLDGERSGGGYRVPRP